MRAEFNGKLELDWISVDERLPLEEHVGLGYGLVAEVFVLVVDTKDFNDDPSVVSIMYELSETQISWIWHDGTPYPECHAKNIRYWCYPPNYDTKQILSWENK